MTSEPNTPMCEVLLTERRRAEESLRGLDPRRYKDVEHWFDKDLYRSLYDGAHGKGSPAHKSEVMRLLRARAAVYRGRRTGTITFDPRHPNDDVYDSEAGNEQMAQTIDACLEALGDGPELTELQRWDDFIPDGFV